MWAHRQAIQRNGCGFPGLSFSSLRHWDTLMKVTQNEGKDEPILDSCIYCFII